MIPIGYQLVGSVGFTDKGTYNSEETYMENDIVHYLGSLWRCKADNTSNITPSESNTWTIFISGGNHLATMEAIDTDGILGTPGATVMAQNLVDKITDKVIGNNGQTVVPITNPTPEQIASFPVGAIWISVDNE